MISYCGCGTRAPRGVGAGGSAAAGRRRPGCVREPRAPGAGRAWRAPRQSQWARRRHRYQRSARADHGSAARDRPAGGAGAGMGGWPECSRQASPGLRALGAVAVAVGPGRDGARMHELEADRAYA